ncbi:MAG: hypothetical protein PVG65_00115 [Candidatus Thorarchaeota archaeon]|jgi:hypothetical protein
MKLFLKYKGQEYGYINESIPDEALNATMIAVIMYSLMRQAGIVTDQLDQELGEPE